MRVLADGRMDVGFVGVPSAGLSLGEETVLAVARAVGHRDLDDHEIAIVGYRADLIDLNYAEAIWRLATSQLQGMPHRVLRTLVIVAQAPEIHISLHCQPDKGFDLALYGERLLRRKRSDELRATVAEVAARRQEPLVLFLGAGFSASSRMPMGDTLRDASLRRVLAIPAGEVVTSSDLALRFHRLLDQRLWLTPAERDLTSEAFAERLTLERVIQVENDTHPTLPTLLEFRDAHDSVVHTPGSAVLDLAWLLATTGHRIILVTVNMDRLVEENVTAPLKVFVSRAEFRHAGQYVRRYAKGDEVAVPYLKLHGCISELSTCVMSTDQTQLGLGDRKLRGLRAAVGKNRLWIYIGASLRDLDLRPILLSEEFARLDERWVNPYWVESYDEFAERRLPFWRGTSRRSLEERLVTETADTFLGALRTACSALDRVPALL
ncbi:MAG: hypothetical protein ACLQGJ_03325 [Candidatus Dormibacteria bacterium]